MKNIGIICALVIVAAGISGCGQFSRNVAKVAGHSTVCVDGVTYLQFPSGVTIKVDRSGKPVPC